MKHLGGGGASAGEADDSYNLTIEWGFSPLGVGGRVPRLGFSV